MIPGISSQPSEFADGMKVNTISELTPSSGVQIQGRTSGVAIGSGLVGEVLRSGTFTAVTLTVSGNTYTTPSLITLSPGSWLIHGRIWVSHNTTTTTTLVTSITTVSGSEDVDTLDVLNGISVVNASLIRPLIPKYITVTTATSLYITARAVFTGGSPAIAGGANGASNDSYLRAIRIA